MINKFLSCVQSFFIYLTITKADMLSVAHSKNYLQNIFDVDQHLLQQMLHILASTPAVGLRDNQQLRTLIIDCLTSIKTVNNLGLFANTLDKNTVGQIKNQQTII